MSIVTTEKEVQGREIEEALTSYHVLYIDSRLFT